MKIRTSTDKVQNISDGFTGLRDKNGVEIYENDIILIEDHYYGGAFTIRFDYQNSTFEIFGPPCWRASLSSIATAKVEQRRLGSTRYFHTLIGDGIEVIGNMHDTPELLTQKEAEIRTKRDEEKAKTLDRAKRDLEKYNKLPWRKRIFNPFRIRGLYETE